MGLVRFSYPELVQQGAWRPFKFDGARQHEKNWIALGEVPAARGDVAPRDLLVSYSVEPHVVLRCKVLANHRCVVEHNTSAAPLFRRRLGAAGSVGRLLVYFHDVALHELRGGSSCVRMPRDDVAGFVSAGQDALVCIGHWHNNYAMYLHFMYLVEEAPPYRVTAVSYPFRFRRYFDDERDRIQFAAGTSIDEAARTLRISFGVADCVASETTISTAEVAAMLRGDLVLPRL